MTKSIAIRIALAASVAGLLLSTLGALERQPAHAGPPIAVAAGGSTKAATPTLEGQVNINTATAQQLQLLPGIGKTKAERIVAWRNRHGKFKRIIDLRRVKGFGKKSVAKLAPYLTLTGPTTLAKR